MPILLTDDQVAEGRERIRRVAERQVVERGLERVSMHSIAQELGWSATALYRYFPSKDALLAATRAAALNALSETLEAVVAGPGDIWARSREVGAAYVDFAIEQPHAYKLIFALSQPEIETYPELAAASRRARDNLIAYAREMVDTGGLDIDPELLGHIFWAQTHGLLSLQMAGQLSGDRPSFDAIRHEMVSRIVQSARMGASRTKEPAR